MNVRLWFSRRRLSYIEFLDMMSGEVNVIQSFISGKVWLAFGASSYWWWLYWLFLFPFIQEDRENILRARATGKAVLTSPFRLPGSNHLGVVLTFPVYSSSLPADATGKERIAATAGWAFFFWWSIVLWCHRTILLHYSVSWTIGSLELVTIWYIPLYFITNMSRLMMCVFCYFSWSSFW